MANSHRQAQKLLESGQIAEAESAFRSILRSNPSSHQAHFGLAQCMCQDKRRLPDALQHMEQATQRHQDPIYLSYRAMILKSMGQGYQAMEALEKVTAAYPDCFYAWQCQALTAKKFGDLEVMERAAKQALALEPDHPHMTNILESLCNRKNESDTPLHSTFETATRHHRNSIDSKDTPFTYRQLMEEGNRVLEIDPQQAQDYFLAAYNMRPEMGEAREAVLDDYARRNGAYRIYRRTAKLIEKKRTVGCLFVSILFFSIACAGLLALSGGVVANDALQKIAGFLSVLILLLGALALTFFMVFFAFVLFFGPFVGIALRYLDESARQTLTREEWDKAIYRISIVFTSLVGLLAVRYFRSIIG